jgi:Acyl-CoA reductase (LuxC)
MGWPPILAALNAGYNVRVKCGHAETLWPRLLVESIDKINPEIASRITFHDDREDIPPLILQSSAVICYGSDDTIATIKAQTPPEIPFYGFGHALSIIYVRKSGPPSPLIMGGPDPLKEWDDSHLANIAKDTLMYAQSGCLSPQYCFVDGGEKQAESLAEALACVFSAVCDQLEVPPVTNPSVAMRVNGARALALFGSNKMHSDPKVETEKRWTIIATKENAPLPPVVGHSTLFVIPVKDGKFLKTIPKEIKEHLSCVGVTGSDALDSYPFPPSVRVCRVGEMQAPPLLWKNGGIDLFERLYNIS